MKSFEDYRKVREVIKSCNNKDQLRVGVKLFNLLNKKYSDVIPPQYFEILENIIGLMRLKCGVENIEEEAKWDAPWRAEAGPKGPPLNQISFIREEDVTGGVGDNMDAESIAEKYDLPLEEIKKEIYIGSQIEKEHTNNIKVAEEFAIDHIVKFIEEDGDYDYYTDPQYGIISVEDRMGENKKTLRIPEELMDQLHQGEDISLDGIDLSYKEDVTENLDFNNISKTLRKQLKNKNKRKFSKSEIFDKIRQQRSKELERREIEQQVDDELWDRNKEEEIEEATGASSAGAFEPALDNMITRPFYDIPVTTDVVKKGKMDYPIGKLPSFKGETNEEEILEEEDLEEATSYVDAVGAYDTPGFAPSAFMGTAGKKGKGRVNKGITHKKLAYPGGDFVKIKNKCARFPYCNQSPEAIKISKTPFKDAFYENKIVKKGKLKIKK